MTRVLAALVAVLALSGCPGQVGQTSIPADEDVLLNVRNPGGSVVVQGVDGADAAVVSWTVFSADGEAASESDADVEFSGEGSRINITVTPAASNVWVDLDVTVPSGAAWAIDSGAGDVTLEKLTGGGSVATTTGFVSGAELSGSMEVGVGTSEVSLGMTVDDGATITVAAESGPIRIGLPPDADALLTASTADGEVVITDVPFSGTNVGGSATGELGAGATATMTLSTGSGDITIEAE